MNVFGLVGFHFYCTEKLVWWMFMLTDEGEVFLRRVQLTVYSAFFGRSLQYSALQQSVPLIFLIWGNLQDRGVYMFLLLYNMHY